MKKYLVVTVDVEPDASWNWQYSDPLDFKAVHIGIKQRLQPLFDEFHMVPTYMINNVVLEDPACVEVFRKLQGKYELGTHLHPEFIEPDKKYSVYAGKRGEANCCSCLPEIEFEKIKNITNLFESDFGYKPTVFRAGRYSAGTNTIRSLAQLGYQVDTSITPHLCWNDKSMESPLDFKNAPEQPYWISEDDIIQEDVKGRLLEVPISIALIKRNVLKELVVSLGGIRHEWRKFKPIWLRPYYSTADQMIKIARQFMMTYENSEHMILNMMFHNVEILPGLSPYTKTESECQRYINQLRQFFAFCLRDNFSSVGLSELYPVYRTSANCLQ
jgi:hypothetical protein